LRNKREDSVDGWSYISPQMSYLREEEKKGDRNKGIKRERERNKEREKEKDKRKEAGKEKDGEEKGGEKKNIEEADFS
jgi:hypothetical protein